MMLPHYAPTLQKQGMTTDAVQPKYALDFILLTLTVLSSEKAQRSHFISELCQHPVHSDSMFLPSVWK